MSLSKLPKELIINITYRELLHINEISKEYAEIRGTIYHMKAKEYNMSYMY
jgi:hypothetical protein